MGLLTHPRPKNTDADDWYNAHLKAENTFIVPSVADYELRREHPRRNATNALAKLDTFVAVPGVYLELTDSALKIAAQFWATARNAGIPTAANATLDADAIIAAQAKDYGVPDTEYIIATVNVVHLSVFVPAETWHRIAA